MNGGADWTMLYSYDSDDEEEELEMAEEEEEEEESPAVKRMRHLSNEGSSQQAIFPQLVDGPGPLGLNLTKSPSLVELMQRELDNVNARTKGKQATECSSKARKRKLTTSHFDATLLRIGNWQWTSAYKGDLVAKFYFVKNKIVWEMIYQDIKHKIEIMSFHISAFKATRPSGSPGTLEITVAGNPSFHREVIPRPRRCTTWSVIADFTGGQAGFNRHVLYCEPGVIDKHVDHLFSKDQCLYALSMANAPATEVLNNWAQQNSYPAPGGGYQFGTGQIAPAPAMADEHVPTGTTTGVLDHNGNLYGGSSLGAVLPRSVEPLGVGYPHNNSNDMFNWDNYFQLARATAAQPLISNGGNTTGNVVNHINNQMNSGISRRGLHVSPSSVALPRVIRRIPDNRMLNQSIAPVNHAINAGNSVYYQNSVPATLNAAATQAQLTRGMLNSRRTVLPTPPLMDSHQPVFNANAGIVNNTVNTGNLADSYINSASFRNGGDLSSNRLAPLPVNHNTARNDHRRQVHQRSFQSSGNIQSSSRVVLPGSNWMNSNNQRQRQRVIPRSVQSAGQSSSGRTMLPVDNSMNTSNHQHMQQARPWSFQGSTSNQLSSRMTMPGSDIRQQPLLADNSQLQANPWSSYPTSGVHESPGGMVLSNNNIMDSNYQQVDPWSGIFEPSSMMAPHEDNSQLQNQVDPWIESMDAMLFTDSRFNGGGSSSLPDLDSAAFDEMYRELVDEEAVAAVAAELAAPAEEEVLATSAPNSLPRLDDQPAAPSAPLSSQSSTPLHANNAADHAPPPTQVTDAAGSGSKKSNNGNGGDDDWLAPLIDWSTSP